MHQVNISRSEEKISSLNPFSLVLSLNILFLIKNRFCNPPFEPPCIHVYIICTINILQWLIDLNFSLQNLARFLILDCSIAQRVWFINFDHSKWLDTARLRTKKTSSQWNQPSQKEISRSQSWFEWDSHFIM